MTTHRKVLVCGGAGFIGSHLCHALLQQHATVFCLDNFITGRKDNILSLLDHPQFFLIQQDVCDPIDLEIDEIYHLASPASPIHYQRHCIETNLANTTGTLNLLRLAKKNHARFLFASTSEIYGNPLQHPQSEEYFGNVNCYGPRACYDESKRCGESLVYDFQHRFGVNTAVVRIFNTYGPHMAMDDGRVISNFITQALQNKPLSVYGEGLQTRSLCYVADLVAGLLKLMATSTVHRPINLGNPNELTVIDIAKRILALTHSQSTVEHHPLPKDDPLQRRPNITLAQQLLEWEPTYPLDTGLKKTIIYYQNELAAVEA